MGERRSLPRAQMAVGEAARVKRPAYVSVAGQRMGERRSSAQACPVNNVSGKAARREAASLLATADRRMSKLRPGCVSAMPQSMRNQSKRQTHSDRPSEDEAQGACSVPGVQRMRRSTPTPDWCPATEAINFNHRTGVQRAKGLSLQPPDWTEDEGLGQLRRFGPRCLRRTSVNSASAAFPRGRPGESESSSGHARATGITHPGFYGRKPWRKPNSAVIIARPAPR